MSQFQLNPKWAKYGITVAPPLTDAEIRKAKRNATMQRHREKKRVD